uniref:Extended synaptotagmin-3 n=1 Tax=Amphiprion ocellaris TaxID=80972 RepID=A0AAQ5XPL3_AMPOC
LSQEGGPAQAADLGGSSEQLSPSAVNRVLMEFLMYFGRAVFLFYPVYLTGYLGLSISWVLLCMLMVTWWKKNRQRKDARIGGAIEFVDNETHVINTELKSGLQMASWVHFTDVEKVHWVNKVVEQAWPFFGMYMEKLLKVNIQAAVRQSSAALKTFTFTKVHFGHIPLRITGMKAYTHEVDQREVVLDLNICYDGDVDIDAEVKSPITAGVKGLKVSIFPLSPSRFSIFQLATGGRVFYCESCVIRLVCLLFLFLQTLQINWTGATNLLDSPAFRLDTIMDIIASLMVLPNRMCIPLIDQVKVDQMRFPLPRGVVRVHLLEARDLLAKDTYMMGLVKGKSDPYATLRVGNRQVKSKTIKENLHPRWNEVYEFVVHEAPGQELEVELYDEDTDKDDLLGTYLNISVSTFTSNCKLQLCITQLPAVEVSYIKHPITLLQSTDGLACAMLAVYLDNASNIPKDHSEITEHHKHGKHSKEARLTRRTADPNSFVEFSIDKDVQKSKVVYASKDPVFEEGFTFFVHSVKTQQLTVQVKEPEKKTPLGVLNLPLNRLLNTSNMTLDQRFPLERSGANSHIKLKAILRILTEDQPPPKIIVDPLPQPKQQTLQSNQGGNTSLSTGVSSSPEVSSNNIPAASPPTRLAYSQNGSSEDYLAHPHGSYLAGETWKSPSSAQNMRRFDSHSLLSENSIASSRFDLSDGASYPEAIRKHQGSFGEINLTVRYATLRNKLIVMVNSCRNLFPCSENGTDSYVRLYLLPDQTWRHRKKTHVKKRTVNPVFNDKFEFDVSLHEAHTRKLDVAVKNNRMFHTRERKDIGMVMLDLSQLDIAKGITEWYGGHFSHFS